MATLKQKAALVKIVENGGNVSRAMREVGYSKETAKSPSKLTNSLGWQELIKEYLPDEKLLFRHEEIIETGEDKDAVKALDLAYKLKGSYAAEKTINLNVEGVDELKSLITGQLSEFRKPQ